MKGRWLEVLLVVLFSACGGSPPPPAPVPKPEPVVEEAPPPQVLAVVPVTKGKRPKLAAALDQAMQEAALPGATKKTAGAPLDVVQLAIECVDATPECHAGVAKSLEANQILVARVSSGGTRGEVRVEVLRTDDKGATLGAATWTYKNEAEAIAEAQGLVARALAGTGEKASP